MKGKHKVIVETEHIRYEFEIKRNITIIQGDSATGKTTLIDLLRQYSQRQEGSGVRVQSDKRCIVYGGTNDNWKPLIEAETDSIIFVDEDYSFIFTKDFAETIRNTGNYYVFITRKPIKTLPYSSAEIYGIRNSGKYNFPHRIYNEFYPIYPGELLQSAEKTIYLLVEDSNSGFQFFEKIVGEGHCLSAEGNSKVYNKLIELDKNQSPVAIIVDGAAFGAYVESVLSISNLKKDVSIYLPESFEWLILKSGIISKAGISEVLSAPEDYIESSLFFSWERFFTDYLEKCTEDDKYKKYNKKKLVDYYLSDNCIRKVIDAMPGELRQRLGQ